MADPQDYTTVHLKDGTTVHLKGRLSPEEIGPKLAAFQKPQQDTAPSAPPASTPLARNPNLDPPSPLAAKIGSMVPEALTSPLAWFQRNINDPLDKMASSGAAMGRELGRDMFGEGADLKARRKYGMEKSPILDAGLGVAGGVGSVVGGTAADPRNWPLLGSSAARPVLQRAISGGFALMMGKGTLDAATQLHDNWDNLTPEQRYELGTQGGLSALMTAASAHHALSSTPVPAVKDTPIAGTGKMESEVKSQVKPAPASQSTGSSPLTHEQIKARLAAIKMKSDAPVAAKPALPVAEDPVEAVRRRVPEEAPAPVAPVNQVPEGQRASDVILRDQAESLRQKLEARGAAKQQLELPKPVAAKPAPPAMQDPVTPERAAKVKQILDDANQLREKPAIGMAVPDQVFQRMREMREQGLTEPEQVFTLMKEFPAHADKIAKAFGSEVGREATPPEASKPAPAVQAPDPQPRPGEPVREAARPEVKAQAEPRLREDIPAALRPDLGQRPAEPPKAPPRDFAKEMEVFKQRVQKFQEEHPGVPKSHAQQVVSEQMRKERGSLGGSPPEDRGDRRQAKIKYFLDIIRDPKSSPEALDQAYKMLTKVYDFSHDDIIAKMAGGADFAKTPPESEADQSLNERLGPNPELDRKADELMGNKPHIFSDKELGDRGFGGHDIRELLDREYLKYEGGGYSLGPKAPKDWILRQIAEGYQEARSLREQLRGGKPIDAPAEFKQEMESQLRAFQQRENRMPNAEEFAVIKSTVAKILGHFGEDLDWINFKELGAKVLAKREGERVGDPGISGIKDPGIEELERVQGLPDNREIDAAQKAIDAMRAAAAHDTATLDQVRKDHPNWSLSEQLQEAAKRAKERRDLLSKPASQLTDEDKVRLRKEIDDALKEQRKKRPGERGSISFRRLTPEEYERANPLRRLADVLDKFANFIDHGKMTDEQIKNDQQTRNIIRGRLAEKVRSYQEVEHALDEAIKRHDNPVNERENFVKFMDAGEGKPGAEFLAPEDQALATELHSMFEERWEKIKAIKGLEGDGIENYLAHIWEKPGKAQKVLSGLLTGRRPLEGKARFLKERFYQYASQGVDHGLTPVTWNPIRLQLAALFDVDRFLMAHDIKDNLKDAGLVQWTLLRDYKNLPLGWNQLDDKIFKPRAVGEGALKEFGTYYAPEEVARIVNRHLSPGLGANPIYKAVRAYNSRLNMVTLGISAYHGTMISLVSATSDLSLGMQRVFNYKDVGGVRDMLRGTIGTFIARSAAHDYKLGRDIQLQAVDSTANPSLQKYVDLITMGGGRFKQDAWYTKDIAARGGFKNWLRLAPERRFGEMLDRGIRGLSAPILEKYVPYIKLGIASRMMDTKLEAMAKSGVIDLNSISTEMGKIWDSVDNRAGQMVYDNLFWNRTFKDLTFMAVRAVGWDLGSAREYGGGALIDAPRQAAKLLRGERPEITSRIGFTLATPITIGLFGAMVHYLLTGQAPQKTEDYFFPGPEGNKVSFPSYVKDFYAFKQHPLKTMVAKLSPTWGQLSDLYSNADFYGTEIQHPGDPLLKRGFDVLKWYGKSWVPFSYRGAEQRIERGEALPTASITGFFGFMPASPYVTMSKAGTLASDLSSREWKQGPRTSAEANRHTLVQRFEQQVAANKFNEDEMWQAWDKKQIQDTDIARIYNVSSGDSKLQRDFKRLPLSDALAVMREADPNERIQLRDLLAKKYNQLNRYPEDQQKAYAEQLDKYLQ